MQSALLSLIYLAAATLLANTAASHGPAIKYLRLLMTALPAALALQVLSSLLSPAPPSPLSLAPAVGIIALMLGLLRCHAPWRMTQRFISMAALDLPRFDQHNPMHQLAWMLTLFLIATSILRLSSPAAMQDLLSAYSSPASSLLSLTASAIIAILTALMGIGWLIRRDSRQSLARLGLRPPTPTDALAGLSTGIALYVASMLAASLWQNLVPEPIFEAQTLPARHIFNAFSGSLFLGLILALLSALSEEILFRGALQPIFGLLLSSLLFTAMHTQYALTPALAILFFVSLCFGFLRRATSTAAAIIAHFAYNLLPFLIFAFI